MLKLEGTSVLQNCEIEKIKGCWNSGKYMNQACYQATTTTKGRKWVLIKTISDICQHQLLFKCSYIRNPRP